SQHASYGVTVYAPCAGSVTGVETALTDKSVQGRRDQQRPAGNYVLIRCDQTDVDVLMAHLQAGSVRVTKGDSVVPERGVGAVGHSGNSTEPHLHIHAKRGGRPDTGLEGDGVPMALN